MLYEYGMRLRGFAPGCQPMDGLEAVSKTDKAKTGHWYRLIYRRELTDKECIEYELDFVGRVNE